MVVNLLDIEARNPLVSASLASLPPPPPHAHHTHPLVAASVAQFDKDLFPAPLAQAEGTVRVACARALCGLIAASSSLKKAVSKAGAMKALAGLVKSGSPDGREARAPASRCAHRRARRRRLSPALQSSPFPFRDRPAPCSGGGRALTPALRRLTPQAAVTAICSLVSGSNANLARAGPVVQPLLARRSSSLTPIALPAPSLQCLQRAPLPVRHRQAALPAAAAPAQSADERAPATALLTNRPQEVLATVSSDTTIDCAASALKRIARSPQWQSGLLSPSGVATLMWTLREGPPRGKAAAANVIGAAPPARGPAWLLVLPFRQGFPLIPL